MKYCTYCYIFYDRNNILFYYDDKGAKVYQRDDVIYGFEITPDEIVHEYICSSCGSIYKGI